MLLSIGNTEQGGREFFSGKSHTFKSNSWKETCHMLNSIVGNLDNLYSSLELLKKVVIIASNLDSSLELFIPRETRPVG